MSAHRDPVSIADQAGHLLIKRRSSTSRHAHESSSDGGWNTFPAGRRSVLIRVFLDFEASSLSKDSYPIEVGWVFEDGRSEAHLIRPPSQWTDWDASAEALHRISRSVLEVGGTPHSIVAHRILDSLAEHLVYASAPSWDGKWLSMLFRAAGLPRHAMRLIKANEAYFEAAAEILHPIIPMADVAEIAGGVVERVRQTAGRYPISHRALEDAKQEREIWLEVRRQAKRGGEVDRHPEGGEGPLGASELDAGHRH